jgi:hypothetical protein
MPVDFEMAFVVPRCIDWAENARLESMARCCCVIIPRAQFHHPSCSLQISEAFLADNASLWSLLGFPECGSARSLPLV